MYYKGVPEKYKMPTLIQTRAGEIKGREVSLNKAQILTYKLGRLPMHKLLLF